MLTVTSPGLYQVLATDPKTCCQSSAWTQVEAYTTFGPEMELLVQTDCNQPGQAELELLIQPADQVAVAWSDGTTELTTTVYSSGPVSVEGDRYEWMCFINQ